MYNLEIRESFDKIFKKLFKKDNTKRIIESFDRDYPTKFMLKLISKEPRLLYFLRFLF